MVQVTTITVYICTVSWFIIKNVGVTLQLFTKLNMFIKLMDMKWGCV